MNKQARTAIVSGVVTLAVTLAYAGCTQDFDQFAPKGSSSGGGTAATATGGSSTTTNSGGSGADGGLGIGGQGGAPECTGNGDCSDNNPCTTDTCAGGECTFAPVPDGALGNDVTTDCVDVNCVGGQQMTSPDDTEVADDSNDCTVDSCNGGQAVNEPVDEGTPCPAGFCNDMGQCAGCTTDEQCGQDDFCKQFNCNGGICETDYTAAGDNLPFDQQTPGNCVTLECDGNGNVVSTPNGNDLPDDNNPCTEDQCDNGQPSNPPEPAGTGCNVPGPPKVCDGNGTCVECVDEGDCAPADTCVNNQCTCAVLTCAGLGLTCGTVPDGCGGMLNCNNGVQDGSETDVDCGGSMPSCPVDCTLGKKCAVVGDCVNAQCVDGVCCASLCSNVCQACNVQGSLGMCVPVPALQEDGALCMGNNSCNGMGACLLDNGQMCMMGSQCASGACTGGTCQ